MGNMLRPSLRLWVCLCITETSQPGTLTQLLSTGLREPAHLYNHRTLQLEGAFKAHLVQPSYNKQGPLPLDQDVSGPHPT